MSQERSLSLADFDASIIARIAQHISRQDRVSLRATCRIARAAIRAPHKRTPQKQWRWAVRRGDAQVARESVLAGARDLQRYSGDTATLDECINTWTAQFARESRAAHRDSGTSRGYDNEQFSMTRAIFVRNYVALIALASTDFIFSDQVLMRVGKYFPDTKFREFLGRFAKNQGGKRYVDGMRAMIKGAMKKQRPGLAQLCVDIATYKRDKIERAFNNEIILQGNVARFCEYQHFKVYGCDMYTAALSGNREMCEHIRANIAGPFSFGYMMMGAVDGGHVHIINLALEWADKCATDDEISFSMPDEYIEHPEIFRADCIFRTLTQMLQRCIARGSSVQVFRALFDHCAIRAKLAQTIDYVCAARILRRGPVFAQKCIERIKAREESPNPAHVITNYDATFRLASDIGAYWLIDVIYEQAEKEGRTREICIRNALAALVLRGRFARKIQEHLAA